jgi:hypothetical protein
MRIKRRRGLLGIILLLMALPALHGCSEDIIGGPDDDGPKCAPADSRRCRSL